MTKKYNKEERVSVNREDSILEKSYYCNELSMKSNVSGALNGRAVSVFEGEVSRTAAASCMITNNIKYLGLVDPRFKLQRSRSLRADAVETRHGEPYLLCI